jgi:23S rRNA (cytidine2498-2'-O)-methyltransferase
MVPVVDPPPPPCPRGGFLLATCQAGAEATLAGRMLPLLQGAGRGAWRRGLVTVRLPPGADPPDDPLAGPLAGAVFARTLVRCFGQVSGADDATRTGALLDLVPRAAFGRLHLWPRDPRAAANDDPHGTGLAASRTALHEALPGLASEQATTGELVLDVVVDGPERWWVGWHRATTPSSHWPGGFHPRSLPGDKVSRAWLKLDEALVSFAIPLAAGARAVELGAAPGGASQRLLEAGLDVVGIDPALVDPLVAAHPRFTHWRKRARDVRLRDFRSFDWIVADMNIDPTSTMEAIGRIVTAPGVRPRGIIATLKLPDWSRATALDGWLATVRAWGYAPQVRQLSTGGREVCLVALRSPGPRRATQRQDP